MTDKDSQGRRASITKKEHREGMRGVEAFYENQLADVHESRRELLVNLKNTIRNWQFATVAAFLIGLIAGMFWMAMHEIVANGAVVIGPLFGG